MAEKNNAFCSICGRGYYMCKSCRDTVELNPWKLHTDTSEHFQIYQIIHGYSVGVYDKAEANAKLKNVDLSELASFRDNIKTVIKDILNYQKEQRVEQKTAYNKNKEVNNQLLKKDKKGSYMTSDNSDNKDNNACE